MQVTIFFRPIETERYFVIPTCVIGVKPNQCLALFARLALHWLRGLRIKVDLFSPKVILICAEIVTLSFIKNFGKHWKVGNFVSQILFKRIETKYTLTKTLQLIVRF